MRMEEFKSAKFHKKEPSQSKPDEGWIYFQQCCKVQKCGQITSERNGFILNTCNSTQQNQLTSRKMFVII